LSAMHGLGSFAKRPSYIQALIHCMGTRPSRVRYAALRAVSDAREELCALDSIQGVDANLLDGLSCALLTAITSGSDVLFHPNRDRCYFRIISALARSDEWCQRLASHGHIDRCISLLHNVLIAPASSFDLNFYLAGIFARIDPSGRNPPFSPDQKEWQTLMRKGWEASKLFSMQECVGALPALVTATRKNLPEPGNGFASTELADLNMHVSWVLDKLLQERPEVASVALPSVQCLSDDLHRIIAHAQLGTPRTSI